MGHVQSGKTVAVGEILRANALELGTKLGKGGLRRARIGGVRSYEEIDVLRKAGLRMQDDGAASDNEVFNAMGMEGGQKVFVVLVQWALLLR